MSSSSVNQRNLKGVLPWICVGVLVLLLAAHLLYDSLLRGRSMSAAEHAGKEAATEGEPASLTTVTLPEGKWNAAKIATDQARITPIATAVIVPGKIEPNTDRRVEIRPRASGVIRKVDVVLGQKIKKGDRLVTLDSAEIGKARINLRSEQGKLATAWSEADWKTEIAANVEQLIPELRKGVEAAVLEKSYNTRSMGLFRAQLLQAYAELDMASHEEQKTRGLYKENILGEHLPFMAKHSRESAQAKFEAALEQARYDATQQKRIAEQQLQDARGAVIAAAQELRILGVHEDIGALLARSTTRRATSVDEDITAYEIVAPMDGTIIAKTPLAVRSQKVEMNDILFTLADLSNVWVSASIPESDFATLPAFKNGTIRLTAAAYPEKTFDAKLLSIGSVVDSTTRTVPLLAETPNPGDLLKLGMFITIELDAKASEEALTVPTSAVVDIENRDGVFVPSSNQERTYTFRPIKAGRESNGRRMVLSGLSKGEAVVSSGAFLLKSELILQNETEEE